MNQFYLLKRCKSCLRKKSKQKKHFAYGKNHPHFDVLIKTQPSIFNIFTTIVDCKSRFMKSPIKKKSRITLAAWAFILSLLISGCSTYRNGFLKIRENQNPNQVYHIDSIQQKKETLFNQTRILMAVFDTLNPKKEAIPPDLSNDIFGNLQEHFAMDAYCEEAVKSGRTDIIKEQARKCLVHSAANYHQLFQDKKYFRRVINRGNKSFEIEKKNLLHSQRFLWNPANRHLLKNEIPEKKVRGSKTAFLCRKNGDHVNGAIYTVSASASELFGRLVAGIHKKPEPEKNVGRLMPHLRKWDIILQKSPGRLTDKFIPGFFGHAAIYLGDSVFAEGIQHGIVASDPLHFAEGESFLIIRPKNLSKEKEKRIENLVRGQIGKKYDFHYNANSPDRLFCTELVYFVYDSINWKTQQKSYGVMMFPDSVVETALASENFSFPLFFDSEKLVENPKPEFIKSLLTE